MICRDEVVIRLRDPLVETFRLEEKVSVEIIAVEKQDLVSLLRHGAACKGVLGVHLIDRPVWSDNGLLA